MEVEYSYQGTVGNTVATLWHYYSYIYSPRAINNLLSAGIFFLLYKGCGGGLIWFAIILLGLTVVEFPAFCYRCVKTARSSEAYKVVTRIRLNEESLTIERGCDSANTGLKSLSGYFIYRKRLFLLIGGKSLMCAINFKEMPENMETASALMAGSPVRKWKFLSFRNWYFTLILLVLAALIILSPAIA